MFNIGGAELLVVLLVALLVLLDHVEPRDQQDRPDRKVAPDHRDRPLRRLWRTL